MKTSKCLILVRVYCRWRMLVRTPMDLSSFWPLSKQNGRYLAPISSLNVHVWSSNRLDGKHVVFGQVVQGMEVVKKMEEQGSKSGKPKAEVIKTKCFSFRYASNNNCMYRWKLQTVDSCRIESKISNRKFYSLFLLVLYFSLGFCFLSLLTDVASYIKSARISWIKAVVLYWLDVENTYLIDYFNPLKNYKRNPLSAYD